MSIILMLTGTVLLLASIGLHDSGRPRPSRICAAAAAGTFAAAWCSYI